MKNYIFLLVVAAFHRAIAFPLNQSLPLQVRSLSIDGPLVAPLLTFNTRFASMMWVPGLTENLKEMAMFSALTVLGDGLAQSGSVLTGLAKEIDFLRLFRFAIFGFADGAFNHAWYHLVDRVISFGTDRFRFALKVLADIFICNPVWNIWFIGSFTLLEKKGFSSILRSLKESWWELTVSSTGFYLPLALLMYSVVPLERRTLVLSISNVVFICLLSLWKSLNRSRDAGRSQ
jgi:hypothetical protein